MSYLYGDSTPSPLTSNFLEYLRDSLDFSVFVLQADDEIALIHQRAEAAARVADEEIARLEAFGRTVSDAIDQAAKGEPDSETSRRAAQLSAASADCIQGGIAAVRAQLEADRGHLAREEATQRQACFEALEKLLQRHVPHETATSNAVERTGERAYAGGRACAATFGLNWRIEIAVPEGHLLATDSPMERLAPNMEIQVPEQKGWLSKGLKFRPQRLDRFLLVEANDDGETVTLKLRADAAGTWGLEFVVDPATGSITASRSGAADQSAGPFEVQGDDAPKITMLATNARTALSELDGGRLLEATLGEAEFKLQPVFADFVRQLVAFMAPITREVTSHSLTPNELVLRRLLSKERREEMFVSKSVLRDKYQPLRPELRALFADLGLDPEPPPLPSIAPEAVTPDEDGWSSSRGELAPSHPPPPLRSSPPPRAK